MISIELLLASHALLSNAFKNLKSSFIFSSDNHASPERPNATPAGGNLAVGVLPVGHWAMTLRQAQAIQICSRLGQKAQGDRKQPSGGNSGVGVLPTQVLWSFGHGPAPGQSDSDVLAARAEDVRKASVRVYFAEWSLDHHMSPAPIIQLAARAVDASG